MRTTGCVSKREEKAFSLSMLFVLIPHYKPCEKRLLYPLVKKLLTGQLVFCATDNKRIATFNADGLLVICKQCRKEQVISWESL
jgi:hypothetical protein